MEYLGLQWRAWHDETGRARIVSAYPIGKVESRMIRSEDLKAVLEHYPDVEQLSGAPRIDDHAAELISGLSRLEVLQAKSIHVTAKGLAALKRLPRLRMIRARMSEEMHARLTEALPECDIRPMPLP